MNKKNKKLLTLLLAGACCAATIAGTAFTADVTSSAAATTYALTDVFKTSEAAIDVANSTTAFDLKNTGSVSLDRNLALKWFEGKGVAKYFNTTFVLGDLNFSKLTLKIESAAAVASEDDKAVNTVEFTNANGVVSVSVNGGEKKATTFAKDSEVRIALNEEGCEYGEFNVLVNEIPAGKFTGIGANYAEKTSAKKSFQFEAELPSGQTATRVLLKQINGQAFDNANSDKKVTDNAAPVLVVNEEFSSFQLGSQFSLDFKEIDVLDSTPTTAEKQYYQWNGTEATPEYVKMTSTNPYFMDTVYTKNGESTSVYAEYGEEYVSIKFTLGDDSFNATSGDYAKKTYDLSWYATGEGSVVTKGSLDYILLTRNQQGATYRHLEFKEIEGKWGNSYLDKEEYEKYVEKYQTAVSKAAENSKSGSNSYVYFPSLSWLIDDDNGYSNLKFTISYKAPSSTSTKTSSNLSASSLKLAATDEGWYEFKVFATDKAGNAMKYYNKDGELVDVTSTNIWDIDEIPSFTYEVKNADLSVKYDSASKTSLRTTKVLNETYTFSAPTLVGANNELKSYKLYKVNVAGISNNDLISVSYADILTEAKATTEWTNKEYHAAYVKAYAKLLSSEAIPAATIAQGFVEIDEYNDRITEEDEAAWNASDNRFNWISSAGTFTTAEEGLYVIVADYWETELPQQRAAAYKVIVVESEADIIKGETEWLKNNIVSVVLFSIAAVMLILIIILLLIKPSDETLEDVDVKAAKKKAVKAKKEKKND